MARRFARTRAATSGNGRKSIARDSRRAFVQVGVLERDHPAVAVPITTGSCVPSRWCEMTSERIASSSTSAAGVSNHVGVALLEAEELRGVERSRPCTSRPRSCGAGGMGRDSPREPFGVALVRAADLVDDGHRPRSRSSMAPQVIQARIERKDYASALPWRADLRQPRSTELERSYREAQERMSDPSVYNDHREAAEVGPPAQGARGRRTSSRRNGRALRDDLAAARDDPDLRELVPELEERTAQLEEELRLAMVQTRPRRRART